MDEGIDVDYGDDDINTSSGVGEKVGGAGITVERMAPDNLTLLSRTGIKDVLSRGMSDTVERVGGAVEREAPDNLNLKRSVGVVVVAGLRPGEDRTSLGDIGALTGLKPTQQVDRTILNGLRQEPTGHHCA